MEPQVSSPLMNMQYKEEESCLYYFWKKETAVCSWEDIRAAFIKYVEFIEFFKPSKILVDERHMFHIFVPEEQKWIDANIVPRILDANLQKLAIIKSEDIFVELASDMMMRQYYASKLQARFFIKVHDAEEWLLGKSPFI